MSDNRVPSTPRKQRNPKEDEKIVHASCRREGCNSMRCTTTKIGNTTRFKCVECGFIYSVQTGGGINI